MVTKICDKLTTLMPNTPLFKELDNSQNKKGFRGMVHCKILLTIFILNYLDHKSKVHHIYFHSFESLWYTYNVDREVHPRRFQTMLPSLSPPTWEAIKSQHGQWMIHHKECSQYSFALLIAGPASRWHCSSYEHDIWETTETTTSWTYEQLLIKAKLYPFYNFRQTFLRQSWRLSGHGEGG